MPSQAVHPDLARLADFFPPGDVEWRVGSTTKDKGKGMALAYLTSRAVQDRLDEVCGPDGWRNEFRQAPEGGVLCGIAVRVAREDGTAEWITKWDGAENTDVEAVKGGLSNAMKRAAVQWGIGRYLYRLPSPWVRLDERGRFAEPPRIPPEFLPAKPAPARPAQASPAASPPPSDALPERKPSPAQLLDRLKRAAAEKAIHQWAEFRAASEQAVAGWPVKEAAAALEALNQRERVIRVEADAEVRAALGQAAQDRANGEDAGEIAATFELALQGWPEPWAEHARVSLAGVLWGKTVDEAMATATASRPNRG